MAVEAKITCVTKHRNGDHNQVPRARPLRLGGPGPQSGLTHIVISISPEKLHPAAAGISRLIMLTCEETREASLPPLHPSFQHHRRTCSQQLPSLNIPEHNTPFATAPTNYSVISSPLTENLVASFPSPNLLLI
ncbi:hypothetical protein PGT21_014338 [Puccinia graminis f. sp. tritici]|uniref:Uncharacterized protein n=1 Tax=Puccinia graminis f. sp. tritici TaxID=56615 RepID=A0A5B0NJC0_PUCGR|nr:hypothetical protein PGT21_014338 [Puccinia graminis f. sp. tritici]